MSKPKETYILTLTPIPWAHDDRPGIIRLKHALKTLLRGFGLRCTNIDFDMPDTNTNQIKEPADEPNKW